MNARGKKKKKKAAEELKKKLLTLMVYRMKTKFSFQETTHRSFRSLGRYFVDLTLLIVCKISKKIFFSLPLCRFTCQGSVDFVICTRRQWRNKLFRSRIRQGYLLTKVCISMNRKRILIKMKFQSNNTFANIFSKK